MPTKSLSRRFRSAMVIMIVEIMPADYLELAGLFGEWGSDYRFDKRLGLCQRTEEDKQ